MPADIPARARSLDERAVALARSIAAYTPSTEWLNDPRALETILSALHAVVEDCAMAVEDKAKTMHAVADGYMAKVRPGVLEALDEAANAVRALKGER